MDKSANDQNLMGGKNISVHTEYADMTGKHGLEGLSPRIMKHLTTFQETVQIRKRAEQTQTFIAGVWTGTRERIETVVPKKPEEVAADAAIAKASTYTSCSEDEDDVSAKKPGDKDTPENIPIQSRFANLTRNLTTTAIALGTDISQRTVVIREDLRQRDWGEVVQRARRFPEVVREGRGPRSWLARTSGPGDGRDSQLLHRDGNQEDAACDIKRDEGSQYVPPVQVSAVPC